MSETDHIISHPTEDDDYYLVDDEGNVIEPAAEGSCLMAEGLLEMAREQTGEDYIVLEPYVPNFDVAEAHAKSLAFFESAARREAEARVEAAVKKGTAEVDHELIAEEEEEEDEEKEEVEEEFEEEEFPTMGSRDMTDPDDWKLEAILKRRQNKEKDGGMWVYLCKWARHDEPTWETREVMEDAGWIPQLDAFDGRGKSAKSFKAKVFKTREVVIGKQIKDDATFLELQSFFGGAEEIVKMVNEHFAPTMQGSVKRFCNLNEARAKAFLARWKQHKDTHVPTIVYHGTRPENFEAINRMGLVVGGTQGVEVKNGTAYGSGVYTAIAPGIPICYNVGCNSLFVCIGLVPINVDCLTAHQINGCVIFRSAADVLPMWLVQYAGREPNTVPAKITFARFVGLVANGFDDGLPVKKQKVVYQPPTIPLPPVKVISEQGEPLTESENRKVDRTIADLKGSVGGIKTKVLRGQPRKVRELLARAAAERRK